MNSISAPVKTSWAISFFVHALAMCTLAPAVGADWTLYPSSAMEITRPVINNPYVLMDRNGYYPWLIWVFMQMPGSLFTLTIFQHLACAGLAAWSVSLMGRWFDKAAAWLCCAALSLCLPLYLIPQVTNSEAAALMPFWLTMCTSLEIGLRRRRGLPAPMWLWGAWAAAAGLAFLARLTGLVLAGAFWAALWLWGASPKRLLAAALGAALVAAPVFVYNKARLGYWGTEYKAGRTLFAVTWQEDKSLRTSNGPASRRLVYTYRLFWPGLQRENPVIQANKQHIDAILDNPREFPYHLYYLTVNLLRREMPYKEADRLMRDVAMEAVKAGPITYVKRRVESFLAAFAGAPPLPLKLLSAKKAEQAETEFYKTEKKYSYRSVSDLYHMRGYSQTEGQALSFLLNQQRLSHQFTGWPTWAPGLAFFRAWHGWLSIDYAWLYGLSLVFLSCLVFFPGRLGLGGRAWPIAAMFSAPLAACLANWAFVYLVSAGRVLHALPCLPFELIMASGGVWAALRAARPKGPRD